MSSPTHREVVKPHSDYSIHLEGFLQLQNQPTQFSTQTKFGDNRINERRNGVKKHTNERFLSKLCKPYIN